MSKALLGLLLGLAVATSFSATGALAVAEATVAWHQTPLGINGAMSKILDAVDGSLKRAGH